MLLLRTFRLLSQKEAREFARWASHESVNRRPEVANLCSWLSEKAFTAETGALAKEAIFRAAFPGEKNQFDDLRLRQTLTYSLALLKNFLTQLELRSDEQLSGFLLCRALRTRGGGDIFEKEWQAANERAARSARRNADWHLANYRLSLEQVEVIARSERSGRVALQPMRDHLTSWYLAEMLRHACSALTHEAVSGQAYNPEILEAVLRMAEAGDFLNSPAVEVYYRLCKALREPEETAHFEALRPLLADPAGHFSPEEWRAIYLLAVNFCIRRLNSGQKNYIREAFELYRTAAEKDLLLENGTVSGFTFKNIIRLGTALGETDWTERFFEKYSPLLPAREREGLSRYNRAFLLFQKKDYARAMPLLQQAELDDTLHLLDARRMLLRSYFELGEFDALDALLHSFTTYLKRQKDLGYHREMYLNLIRFVRKLLEIKPDDRKGREKLRGEIATAKQVAEREWLLSVV